MIGLLAGHFMQFVGGIRFRCNILKYEQDFACP